MKILFIPRSRVLIAAFLLMLFMLLPVVRPTMFYERWREEIYRPGLSGKLVMIDPGHGGADPGAVAGGVIEKNINLAVSQALQLELRHNGVKSMLTREEQGGLNPQTRMTFLERYRNLLARKDLAVDERAHVFVSIHTNSNEERRASGGIVYYNPDNPYNNILAESIQEELNKLYQTSRSAEKADFTVISQNGMPAALVETGFITNPADRKKLTDAGFRQAIARAVHRGLIKYAAKLPGSNKT